MRETKHRFGRKVAVLIVGMGVMTSCSDIMGPELDGPAMVEIVPVETVESIGQDVAFTARVYDRLGRELSGVPLAWEVSHPDILEEVSPGVFRSRGVGEATVRVRASSGVPGVRPGSGYASGLGPRAETAVEVNQIPVRVNLSADAFHLWSLGQERALEAEVVDALGTSMLVPPTITWSSQEEGVAAVDATGRVRAMADGTTRVMAFGGGVSGFADVQVAATIPYTACFSFILASGGSGESQCSTIHITVRERE